MKTLAALILIALAAAAHADSDDQNRAREAYERHEILPLSKILASVKKKYGQNVVDIEYEVQNGHPVYEFEIVAHNGQVIELVINAKTGKPEGMEGEKH